MHNALKKLAPIGLSGYSILKEKSPYATLLLDLSQSLSEVEFSNMKLFIFVDRNNIAHKKFIRETKYPADLFLLLDDRMIISKDNLDYLCKLFMEIGRKDLLERIMKYFQKKSGKVLLYNNN